MVFEHEYAWECIRKYIKTSAKENLGYPKIKHNKPWFDDECSKQAKGSRLNLRLETRRTFRNKKREYLKGKINELKTNNRNKNIRYLYRCINEFKKGYQPGINITRMRMVICLQIHRLF
jgi:hypothetical protein